jgi:hypothetical protein
MKWAIAGGLAFILSCSPNSEKKDELWKRCNTHISQGKRDYGIDPVHCRKAIKDLDEYILLAPSEPDGYMLKFVFSEQLLRSTKDKQQEVQLKHEMYLTLDKMYNLIGKGEKFRRIQDPLDLKQTYDELKKDFQSR